MPSRYFKCACEHCGGRIEYPVDAVGLSTDCPHCGKQTDLSLAEPRDVDTGSRRHFVWLIIGGVTLLIGIGGVTVAFVWLQNLRRKGARPRH